MKYTTPEVELIELDIIDVIQASVGGEGEDNSNPDIDYGDNELPKT